MIKSFRDMEAWQKAYALSLRVFDLTKALPKSEDYALTSQVRRSANSVSGNISEAFERRTKNDKRYFYTISRGSAYETQHHLLYGTGVNYFDSKITQNLIDEYDELIHQLNKIMKSLG